MERPRLVARRARSPCNPRATAQTMNRFRRWSPVLALCLALAGWAGLSPLDFSPAVSVSRAPGSVAVAGPQGRVAAHLDGDHLLDYVTGRPTASGHYLIEVCLSSQPRRTTIKARGAGFAVQDVNADNIADLLIADGLSGSLTELENNGRGHFTSRIADHAARCSSPAPKETDAETSLSSKASRPTKPAVTLSRRLAFEPPPAPGLAWLGRRQSGAAREPLADAFSRGPPSIG